MFQIFAYTIVNLSYNSYHFVLPKVLFKKGLFLWFHSWSNEVAMSSTLYAGTRISPFRAAGEKNNCYKFVLCFKLNVIVHEVCTIFRKASTRWRKKSAWMYICLTDTKSQLALNPLIRQRLFLRLIVHFYNMFWYYLCIYWTCFEVNYLHVLLNQTCFEVNCAFIKLVSFI